MECDGNGYCLTVRNLICQHDCQPVPCPNFFFCENETPQFIFEFNQGVCMDCHNHFGNTVENPTDSNPILRTFAGGEFSCPVCLCDFPAEHGILGPRCDHVLCVDCLRSVYTDKQGANYPPFPYPELEESFFAEPTLFMNDQEIREWKKGVGSWEIKRLRFRLLNRPFLKHCPICRK